MSLDGYFHLWKAEHTLSKVLFSLVLNFKNCLAVKAVHYSSPLNAWRKRSSVCKALKNSMKNEMS